MGGTGSFGAESVTIHHNLLPEERDAIIRKIELLEARLENEMQLMDAAIRRDMRALEAIAKNADSEAKRAHERLNNLINNEILPIKSQLTQLEVDLISAMSRADNAYSLADAAQEYATHTRNNIASPALNKAGDALARANSAYERAQHAHNRIDAIGSGKPRLSLGGDSSTCYSDGGVRIYTGSNYQSSYGCLRIR